MQMVFNRMAYKVNKLFTLMTGVITQTTAKPDFFVILKTKETIQNWMEMLEERDEEQPDQNLGLGTVWERPLSVSTQPCYCALSSLDPIESLSNKLYVPETMADSTHAPFCG